MVTCQISRDPGLSLLPHEGALRQQFQRPQAPGPGFAWHEAAVSWGEMFPSRQELLVQGLGGMVLGLQVGGRTGMKGHEGQARDKLLVSQSALNLLGRPGFGPGVMCGCREV